MMIVIIIIIIPSILRAGERVCVPESVFRHPVVSNTPADHERPPSGIINTGRRKSQACLENPCVYESGPEPLGFRRLSHAGNGASRN